MATELSKAKVEVVLDTAKAEESFRELRDKAGVEARPAARVQERLKFLEKTQREKAEAESKTGIAKPFSKVGFDDIRKDYERIRGAAIDPIAGARDLLQGLATRDLPGWTNPLAEGSKVGLMAMDALSVGINAAEKGPMLAGFLEGLLGQSNNPIVSKFLTDFIGFVQSSAAWTNAIQPSVESVTEYAKAGLKLGGTIPSDIDDVAKAQFRINKEIAEFEARLKTGLTRDAARAVGAQLAKGIYQ